MPWPTCSSFIALVKSLNDIVLIAKSKTTLFPADGIKLRNLLDGLGKNFYDAWGVVFVGLIDAVQVQSEPKVPSSMQLHSWFLKLWPGGCNHTEFFHVFFIPKMVPLFDTQIVNPFWDPNGQFKRDKKEPTLFFKNKIETYPSQVS